MFLIPCGEVVFCKAETGNCELNLRRKREGRKLMKKLLELGDRYAESSSWKDFALVKFCLFAMGLIAGTKVPEKHKKNAVRGALCVFAVTYIPLMAKVFLTVAEMKGTTEK